MNFDAHSVTLHLKYHPTPPNTPPDNTDWHEMAGFGVLVGTNLLGLVVIIARRDIVWCVAATWIVTSLWTAMPKPAVIFVHYNSLGFVSEEAHTANIDNRHNFHRPTSARTHWVHDLRTVLFFASSESEDCP